MQLFLKPLSNRRGGAEGVIGGIILLAIIGAAVYHVLSNAPKTVGETMAEAKYVLQSALQNAGGYAVDIDTYLKLCRQNGTTPIDTTKVPQAYDQAEKLLKKPSHHFIVESQKTIDQFNAAAKFLNESIQELRNRLQIEKDLRERLEQEEQERQNNQNQGGGSYYPPQPQGPGVPLPGGQAPYWDGNYWRSPDGQLTFNGSTWITGDGQKQWNGQNWYSGDGQYYWDGAQWVSVYGQGGSGAAYNGTTVASNPGSSGAGNGYPGDEQVMGMGGA